MAEMTDDQLIGYAELHCTTERALFNGAHINRMIELAGAQHLYRHVNPDEFLSCHHEMEELCEMARARRAAPPTESKS